MGRTCLAVVLLASSVLAQLDSGTIVRHLKVHLRFTNGVCDLSAHVRLIGTEGPIPDRMPDDQCEVHFSNIASGTYQVEVSGQKFAESEELITTTNGTSDFEIEVKNRGAGARFASAGPVVSMSDLSVPAKAVKEFDKSNQLLNRQDFPKAIQSLNRAIAIYPSYAAAYNNLGAIYARLGNRDKEREALEKAIRLNDHFAAAYLNLGRMNIMSGDFPAAEDALSKAVVNDPTDAMAWVLLCYSQFQDQHLDGAIASSQKAHALPGQHSSVHVIAAKSFEHKHETADSISELEVFLKEEPTGERADQARKVLTSLRAIHP
jgi:Flp pilus assembly protein TadD